MYDSSIYLILNIIINTLCRYILSILTARGSERFPWGPYYIVTFIFNDYLHFSVFSQFIIIYSHIKSYIDGQNIIFMLG